MRKQFPMLTTSKKNGRGKKRRKGSKKKWKRS